MLRHFGRCVSRKPSFHMCFVCGSTTARNRTYLDNWLGKGRTSDLETSSNDTKISNIPHLHPSISESQPVRKTSSLPDGSVSQGAVVALSTMHHTGVVRSGQQLFAKDQSLVVVGNVNHGAELMADGDIHVYGRLSGRAVVGLNGNYMAKIYIQQFEASLIGIADCFIVPFGGDKDDETVPPDGQDNIEKDQFMQRNILKSMFGKSVVVSVQMSGVDGGGSAGRTDISSIQRAVIRQHNASDGRRMDMCVALMPTYQ